MRGRWRSWRAPGSVSNVFVFFHYLLWKAKLNFDCLEVKARLVVCHRSIRSGFHCLLWRYENPSLHCTEKNSFIPNCSATYITRSIAIHRSSCIFLQSGTIINYCTLSSVKMIQLTSQEKTLSQSLDNIFSRSRYGFFIYRIIKKNT